MRHPRNAFIALTLTAVCCAGCGLLRKATFKTAKAVVTAPVKLAGAVIDGVKDEPDEPEVEEERWVR